MSQTSFDEATPWPHVWPYNWQQSAILSSLKQAHHAAPKGNWHLTDTLDSSFPSWKPLLLSDTRHHLQTSNSLRNRHYCQSILPGNMLATIPTFSQIFIMAHISRSNLDEEDTSRYPIITTHHRLPELDSGGYDGSKCQPIPAPPLLLPGSYAVDIPVIRDDLIESPPCSPIICAKQGYLTRPRTNHDYLANTILTITPCTPPIGVGQVKPDVWTAAPASERCHKTGGPNSGVMTAQKACILKLGCAWTTFGAPSSSVATRLRYVAGVFGVSLVVISMSNGIMYVFEGSDDVKRPDVHYAQNNRRLSLRNLRQVDIISEELVYGAMHSSGTAMHVHIENAVKKLDNVLLEKRKTKTTRLARVFQRFALGAYSLRVLPSRRKGQPFRSTVVTG